MPKGSLTETRAATSATELRERLREMEIRLASLRRSAVDVESLLVERDGLEDLLSGAEQEGLDVRPERGRAQAVDGVLRARARRFVRLLANKGGFAGIRARHEPADERWWWFLDVYVTQKAKRAVKRAAIITVVVLVVAIAGERVLNHFYGPDPNQRAFSDLTLEAESALREGDTAAAIDKYERAVAVIPADAETQALLGVLYENAGRAGDAQEAFAAAEQYSEDRVSFLFTQARAYLSLNELDRALALAEQAVNTDATSPLAYYVLGEVVEAMGDRTTAAQAFDVAAQFADEKGQTVLYAMARERQAVLLTGGR